MSTSKIVELAALISKSVTVIDQHLEANGLAKPSWDVDAPRELPQNDEISAARDAVLSATTDLRNLILGPAEALLVLGESHNELVSLHAVHRFDMASKFPVGQEISYGALAESCSLSEPVTRQVLRQAMLNHVFTEPRKGVVAHTAASRVLAEDEVTRDFVGVAVEDLWKAATRTVDALQKWPLSEEVAHNGFSLAHNATGPFYVEVGKDAARARRFANSMRAYSAEAEYGLKHLLDAYNWGALGEATVVDVGGSSGAVSAALARRFSDLRFVVQDMEQVIAQRPPLGDPELDGRIEFMAHDFFQLQPVVGADVYYLRWILHNWGDAAAVAILRSLVPALKHGARILLHEQCVPEHSAGSPWKKRRLCAMDMSQLELFNSHERQLDEWQALFRNADSRFKFVEVHTPPLSTQAVIEVTWDESAAGGEIHGQFSSLSMT